MMRARCAGAVSRPRPVGKHGVIPSTERDDVGIHAVTHGAAVYLIPVSYTHLDVYKRQIQRGIKKLLFAEEFCWVDVQGAPHRPGDGQDTGDHHRRDDRGEHERVVRGRTVHNVGEQAAGGQAQNDADERAAAEQLSLIHI